MRPGATFVKDPRVKLGKENEGWIVIELILPEMRLLLLDRLTFDQYRL